jgi:hypothetical protein
MFNPETDRLPTVKDQVECNLCEDLIFSAEEWTALPLDEKRFVAGEEPETF